jgi:hypothetical protein
LQSIHAYYRAAGFIGALPHRGFISNNRRGPQHCAPRRIKSDIMSFADPHESKQDKQPPRVESSLDPTRPKRLSRRAANARRLGVAAAGCILLAVPVSPATAGFFDFLFAPARPVEPAMPVYRRPPHFFHPRLAHVEHHKKKVAAVRTHRIVEAKTHPVAGRAVDLMDDDSLKNGDAVMTADGLRVFVGDEGPHHSEGDFVKISDTDGLSKRERSALLAVDAGHEGDRAALVTGRSAADMGISTGVPMIDSRGHKIRYVGP